ncbi:MAG: hypothetical protein FWG18_03860 [Alphaproteobacteria bacterium]|nr:hypothetical protein [Alphaproteobacteria bacterium]
MRKNLAFLMLAVGVSLSVGFGAIAASPETSGARLTAAAQALGANQPVDARRPGSIPAGTADATTAARMPSMPNMPGITGSGIGSGQVTNLPTGPVGGGGGTVNKCPDGTNIPATGRCICQDGSTMPYTGKCVCPDGNVMPSTGKCICPDGSPMPYTGKCGETPPNKCPDGTNMPPSGKCLCPDGSLMPYTGKCVCPDGTAMPSTGKCNTKPGPDKCPDGSDRNSTVMLDKCMSDILSCVNNSGDLPNGLNDLYDINVRNAIVNGMGLCRTQVEWCIKNVKRNCKPVYFTWADVWLDFNSRVIQPNYYSFILRKTGLTPNQAENTCWLLDKNTYGKSFAAVANDGRTTSEYNNQINAYNEKGGIKVNPMGAIVNDGNPGVDGLRGHYARWDATTGECLVRIAAYNGGDVITNRWLFGALGDDREAEAWKPAGSSFTCGKSLFEFSLLNKTHTAAVLGIGGGTLVGAGIGAIVGYNKGGAFVCSDDGAVKQLLEELRKSNTIGILNEFMDDYSQITFNETTASLKQKCPEILRVYALMEQAKTVDKSCSAAAHAAWVSATGGSFEVTFNGETATGALTNGGFGTTFGEVDVTGSITGAAGSDCRYFQQINLARANGTGIYCSGQSGCITGPELAKEVARLEGVFSQLPVLQGKERRTGHDALVGGAIGAGTGLLITGITNFIERNQISCIVGDGLDKVGFNKTGRIDSLRDFYVKWDLKLPDTIMPTAHVIDCTSWRSACTTIRDSSQCRDAQINFKPKSAKTETLVSGACMMSGSVCIENFPVAVSNGACDSGDEKDKK